jgi:ketosteroid isomerase-like protein
VIKLTDKLASRRQSAVYRYTNEPYRRMPATTSPKLELVRSISAAWERGDYSCVDWAHADIEFVIADGPEPGRWTGRSDLAPSLMDFRSAWEEYRSEAEEYRELDDGVLVLTYASGRGRTSGLPIGEKRANRFQVRDGKVKRLVVYWDRERALADAGLSARTA